MPPENDDDEVSLILNAESQMEEVSKTRKKPAEAHNPDKHLSAIDPVLMEKLSKIEKPESSTKYVDGIPVFASSGPSSPLYGLLTFLFIVLVGFGGIRMYLGEPLVPVALKEFVLGKEQPVILPPARYTIETNILGYEVSVNGVKQSLFNNQFEYPAGKAPVTLTVSRAGYSTFTTQVTPETGTHTKIKPTLTQQNQSTGFLTYETVPEARLTLYQSGAKVAEYNTPINGQKVPVGTYQAVLENAFIGFRKEQMITVEEWKTTSFRLELDNQGAGQSATATLPAAIPVGSNQ
jgi:hypothetical protein